ncbi:MAG: hypothetical protein H6732_02065 [Alphaproteobacteria bacterium]|nr:hypothetical protein [Alphaproteobacteria bacterium]
MTTAYASQRELPVVLWTLGVLSSPFLVFRSGLPQPSDFLLLGAMLSLAVYNRGRFVWPKESAGFVGFLSAFALYLGMVGLTWSALTQNVKPAIGTVFHLYNGFIALGVMAMFQRYGPRLVWVLTTMPAVALVLELVLGMLFYRHTSVRASLTFHNPNSLAHFAVVSCATYFAVPTSMKRPLWQELGVLLVAFQLTVLSASRGGMLALVPLAIQVGMRDQRSRTALLVAGGVGVLGATYLAPDLLEPALRRLGNLEGGRGYSRILEHPWLLVFGAGEGRSNEFRGAYAGHEIHSLPGTIFFSYGIVGSVLFMGMLWQLVLLGRSSLVLALAAPMAFGLTHNIIRQTDFWVLISLLMMRAVASDRQRRRGTTTVTAPLQPTPAEAGAG